jgi:hypothetical protein
VLALALRWRVGLDEGAEAVAAAIAAAVRLIAPFASPSWHAFTDTVFARAMISAVGDADRILTYVLAFAIWKQPETRHTMANAVQAQALPVALLLPFFEPGAVLPVAVFLLRAAVPHTVAIALGGRVVVLTVRATIGLLRLFRIILLLLLICLLAHIRNV